jgi:hypothetical protein
VLERLSKIMSYLRMGASGKGRKLKKREKAALLDQADAARRQLALKTSGHVSLAPAYGDEKVLNRDTRVGHGATVTGS